VLQQTSKQEINEMRFVSFFSSMLSFFSHALRHVLKQTDEKWFWDDLIVLLSERMMMP
jgi:hypothetical protein